MACLDALCLIGYEHWNDNMVDMEDGSVQASGNQKKRNFPDGTNISNYGKYKTWTYRRWAWEFLCRNHNFIKACIRLENGTESEKLQVARDFGLVKFKNYSDVQTRTNIFPTFKDGAIQVTPNLSKENLKKLVGIFPGQVLIRYKLKADVDAIAAIEAQLQRARKSLYKLSAQFNQIMEMPAAAIDPGVATDPISLVQYLRILDLRANGIDSVKEIATYLYGDNRYFTGEDLHPSGRAC